MGISFRFFNILKLRGPLGKFPDWSDIEKTAWNFRTIFNCSMADGISFEVSLSLNCTDQYKREGGA